MRRTIAILTLCIGISISADAQTFTQRIQHKAAGPASVTIHQDTVIDRLVNSATLGLRGGQTSKPVSPSTSGISGKSGISGNSGKTGTSGISAHTHTTSTSAQPDTVDTSKKVMRGVKINGYRVQAFAGGNSRADRQKAERIGNEIKAQYSNVPVYVHFYTPRWICRVGNYRTYEEAHQMLVSLRKMGYNQATIVKGKITVSNY
jgi:hypothetical protein